jgi:hypothetical protein
MAPQAANPKLANEALSLADTAAEAAPSAGPRHLHPCEFHVSPRVIGCGLQSVRRSQAWCSHVTFMFVQAWFTAAADSEWCT